MRVYRCPAGRKRKATKTARHEREMVENKKVEDQSREPDKVEARKRGSYICFGVHCVANPEAQHHKAIVLVREEACPWRDKGWRVSGPSARV